MRGIRPEGDETGLTAGDMQRTPGTKSLFSPFLLYAVCAHVIRSKDIMSLSLGQADSGRPSNVLLEQARLLVSRELDRGSSLSAIQGFLLLSAAETASGRVGQAWLYT